MTGVHRIHRQQAALDWLRALGYAAVHASDTAAGEHGAERRDPGCRDVVLEQRLRAALARLNPELPQEALEDAFRKLTRVDGPSLIERNRASHRMLVDGVTDAGGPADKAGLGVGQQIEIASVSPDARAVNGDVYVAHGSTYTFPVRRAPHESTRIAVTAEDEQFDRV